MDNTDLNDVDLEGKVVVGEQITFGAIFDISKGTLERDGCNIEVAVKLLRVQGMYNSPEFLDRLRKRFYREVLVWLKLQHPNIVPLLGYMMPPSKPPALISPWYFNGNITDYLRSRPDSDRHALALDVVNGLDYLHSIPLIHGDLKPGNVLVNNQGHANLCDFGMSRFMELMGGLSSSYAINGESGRFMSPELLEDEPRTVGTDIWALGCLVVLILTDIVPYQHISRKTAILTAILRGAPPIEEDKVSIDRSLWDCVQSCWRVPQHDRPQAYELRNCLTPLQSNRNLSYMDIGSNVVVGEQVTWGNNSHILKGMLLRDGVELEVAIKSLRMRGTSDSADRVHKRFYREALLWLKLQHPNVVPFLGYMVLTDFPSLISPWYTNGNVMQYLASFPHSDRRALALDVVNGLDYLHSIPVAHGDLKGENVLVDGQGRASLSDFGMAQFLDEANGIEGFTTSNAGRGGAARFMSPELFDDKPRTIASDMWSFGCLIMQIFIDAIPYQRYTGMSGVLSAMMRGVLPVEDNKGSIDGPLWDCIIKCWSRMPDERPTAREFRIYFIPEGSTPEPTDRATMGRKLRGIFGPQKDQPRTGHDLLWVQKLVPSFGELNSDTIKYFDAEIKIAIIVTTKMVAEISPQKREYEIVSAEFQKSPLIKQLGEESWRFDSYTRSGMDWFKAESEEKDAAVNDVMAWFEKLVGDSDFLAAARIDLDAIAQIVTKTGKVIAKYIGKGTFYGKKLILEFGVLRYPRFDDPYFKLYSIKLYAWVDYDEATITGDNGIRGECVRQTYAPNDEGIGKLEEAIRERMIVGADSLFD